MSAKKLRKSTGSFQKTQVLEQETQGEETSAGGTGIGATQETEVPKEPAKTEPKTQPQRKPIQYFMNGAEQPAPKEGGGQKNETQSVPADYRYDSKMNRGQGGYREMTEKEKEEQLLNPLAVQEDKGDMFYDASRKKYFYRAKGEKDFTPGEATSPEVIQAIESQPDQRKKWGLDLRDQDKAEDLANADVHAKAKAVEGIFSALASSRPDTMVATSLGGLKDVLSNILGGNLFGVAGSAFMATMNSVEALTQGVNSMEATVRREWGFTPYTPLTDTIKGRACRKDLQRADANMAADIKAYSDILNNRCNNMRDTLNKDDPTMRTYNTLRENIIEKGRDGELLDKIMRGQEAGLDPTSVESMKTLAKETLAEMSSQAGAPITDNIDLFPNLINDYKSLGDQAVLAQIPGVYEDICKKYVELQDKVASYGRGWVYSRDSNGNLIEDGDGGYEKEEVEFSRDEVKSAMESLKFYTNLMTHYEKNHGAQLKGIKQAVVQNGGATSQGAYLETIQLQQRYARESPAYKMLVDAKGKQTMPIQVDGWGLPTGTYNGKSLQKYLDGKLLMMDPADSAYASVYNLWAACSARETYEALMDYLHKDRGIWGSEYEMDIKSEYIRFLESHPWTMDGRTDPIEKGPEFSPIGLPEFKAEIGRKYNRRAKGGEKQNTETKRSGREGKKEEPKGEKPEKEEVKFTAEPKDEQREKKYYGPSGEAFHRAFGEGYGAYLYDGVDTIHKGNINISFDVGGDIQNKYHELRKAAEAGTLTPGTEEYKLFCVLDNYAMAEKRKKLYDKMCEAVDKSPLCKTKKIKSDVKAAIKEDVLKPTRAWAYREDKIPNDHIQPLGDKEFNKDVWSDDPQVQAKFIQRYLPESDTAEETISGKKADFDTEGLLSAEKKRFEKEQARIQKLRDNVGPLNPELRDKYSQELAVLELAAESLKRMHTEKKKDMPRLTAGQIMEYCEVAVNSKLMTPKEMEKYLAACKEARFKHLYSSLDSDETKAKAVELMNSMGIVVPEGGLENNPYIQEAYKRYVRSVFEKQWASELKDKRELIGARKEKLSSGEYVWRPIWDNDQPFELPHGKKSPPKLSESFWGDDKTFFGSMEEYTDEDQEILNGLHGVAISKGVGVIRANVSGMPIIQANHEGEGVHPSNAGGYSDTFRYLWTRANESAGTSRADKVFAAIYAMETKTFRWQGGDGAPSTENFARDQLLGVIRDHEGERLMTVKDGCYEPSDALVDYLGEAGYEYSKEPRRPQSYGDAARTFTDQSQPHGDVPKSEKDDGSIVQDKTQVGDVITTPTEDALTIAQKDRLDGYMEAMFTTDGAETDIYTPRHDQAPPITGSDARQYMLKKYKDVTNGILDAGKQQMIYYQEEPASDDEEEKVKWKINEQQAKIDEELCRGIAIRIANMVNRGANDATVYDAAHSMAHLMAAQKTMDGFTVMVPAGKYKRRVIDPTSFNVLITDPTKNTLYSGDSWGTGLYVDWIQQSDDGVIIEQRDKSLQNRMPNIVGETMSYMLSRMITYSRVDGERKYLEGQLRRIGMTMGSGLTADQVVEKINGESHIASDTELQIAQDYMKFNNYLREMNAVNNMDNMFIFEGLCDGANVRKCGGITVYVALDEDHYNPESEETCGRYVYHIYPPSYPSGPVEITLDDRAKYDENGEPLPDGEYIPEEEQIRRGWIDENGTSEHCEL